MSQPRSPAPPTLAGCDLSVLDSTACESYLAWLLGEQGAGMPHGATGLDWALGHCDDGVTWGRYDTKANVWRMGSEAAPEVSPPIRFATLQELRFFGESGEILFWRTDVGLRGRGLRETEPTADRSDGSQPLRPSDESRIVRGDHVIAQCAHGFTHIGDRTGAEQVVPVSVTKAILQAARLRVVVRHYYETEAKTGAVRIAATRLIKLTLGDTHGA